MKKIGLLCLALVLALGSLGIGYAMWQDTVTVVTTVYTGTVDMAIVDQLSTDPPPHGGQPGGDWFGPPGKLDPKDGHVGIGDWGGFLFARNRPPTPSSTWSYSGTRYLKNVASTYCTFTADTLTITLDNVYPSYGPIVAYAIQNTGSIPARVYSIKLISVTTPAGTFAKDFDIDANYNNRAYMVDNAGNVVVKNSPFAPGFDDNYAFTFMLTSTPGGAPMLNAQIDPGMGLATDISIHVAQSATQSAQYSFTFRFTFANWNH